MSRIGHRGLIKMAQVFIHPKSVKNQRDKLSAFLRWWAGQDSLLTTPPLRGIVYSSAQIIVASLLSFRVEPWSVLILSQSLSKKHCPFGALFF